MNPACVLSAPQRTEKGAVADSGPARNEPLLLAPVLSSASATSIASSVGLRRVPWLPLAQNRPGPVRDRRNLSPAPGSKTHLVPRLAFFRSLHYDPFLHH